MHSYPWIKSDRDSIRNSCDVFGQNLFHVINNHNPRLNGSLEKITFSWPLRGGSTLTISLTVKYPGLFFKPFLARYPPDKWGKMGSSIKSMLRASAHFPTSNVFFYSSFVMLLLFDLFYKLSSFHWGNSDFYSTAVFIPDPRSDLKYDLVWFSSWAVEGYTSQTVGSRWFLSDFYPWSDLRSDFILGLFHRQADEHCQCCRRRRCRSADHFLWSKGRRC